MKMWPWAVKRWCIYHHATRTSARCCCAASSSCTAITCYEEWSDQRQWNGGVFIIMQSEDLNNTFSPVPASLHEVTCISLPFLWNGSAHSMCLTITAHLKQYHACHFWVDIQSNQAQHTQNESKVNSGRTYFSSIAILCPKVDTQAAWKSSQEPHIPSPAVAS